MDSTQWEAVKSAYALVKTGAAKRIDGANFSLYRAGSIIRLDIKQED